MNLKTLIKFAAVTAAVATMAVAPGAVQAKKLKVGFVYVGPVGDHGWTYQHHQGLLAVKKAFGDKVETTHVENVQEGPDSERVIQQLAQQGHDVIFTTSFGFMNPTLKVASRFPKVKFEHSTGYKRSKNVSTYNIRFYEGRYVAGVVAGKMTKSNTIGYIASFPIPEVIMGINAAYLGAKSVNPNVKFKIVWVSTWFDPGKESDAAKALVDQGADVLFQHTDSPAAMKLAEQRNISAIGQASDMKAFGRKAQLTALVNNWGPYYIARVKAVMDGSWKAQDTWGGLKSGMLTIAGLNDRVPADVKALAAKVQADIASGKLHPFTGPLEKQDGSMFLKSGEKISDKALSGMKFYVKGIEGSLPK
ncbi:MAG: BMP family ABC transporter substrate-binding protein [Rhodospirillaceae bacterium]|nr:BMP family ABC transporter substrate-binding protein [Rhodospirillaceae bacterium]